MDYEPYPFSLNEENTHFKFQSIGKRGVFDKAIVFSQIDHNIYNLALLDHDPATQDYTDKSVTDNGDMPIVLSTVMSVIREYLNQYPDRKIYLVGNSPSRTRLYQIAISKVLGHLEDLTVSGYADFEWSKFEPNRSFESFLIEKNHVD